MFRKSRVLLILFILFFSITAFTYESPGVWNFSIYGYVISFPAIPSAEGGPPFDPIDVKIDANIPLERIFPKQHFFKDAGLYLGARYIFKESIYIPIIEEYTVNAKYLCFRTANLNLTPFGGAKLIIDHFSSEVSFPIGFGIVIGYSPSEWLEIYFPTSLYLYSDGFEYDIRCGIKPYIEPLHVSLDFNFNWIWFSRYDLREKNDEPLVGLGIGGEF